MKGGQSLNFKKPISLNKVEFALALTISWIKVKDISLIPSLQLSEPD